MGGCRCSYRNCTVKSDKKTHMFHFPVFEKLRCYQWIVNSHKFEFLDTLTVSQLKNRVVCQHHFREDCFMNYKKEKLTFEAIPTEDGPYCDSSKESDIDKEAAEKASLLMNDIETESTYIDKKAISSIKYIDFLTNVYPPVYPTDGKSVYPIDGKSSLWIDVPDDKHLKPRFQKTIQVERIDPNIIEKPHFTPRFQKTIQVERIDPNIIEKPHFTRKNLRSTKCFKGKEQDKIVKELDTEFQNEQNKKAQEDIKVDLQSVPQSKDLITFESNNEIHQSQNLTNLSEAPVHTIENMNQFQEAPMLILPLNQSTDFNSLQQSYYSNNQQISSFDQPNLSFHEQNSSFLIQNSSFNEPTQINNNNFAVNTADNSETSHNNERVKILSEKTIYQPLSIVGQFIPVSPSLILQVPKRSKQVPDNLQMVPKDTQSSTLVNEIDSMAIEQKPNVSETETCEDLKNMNVVFKSPPKVDILEIEQFVQNDPSNTTNSVNVQLTEQTEHVEKSQADEKTEGVDNAYQTKNVECKDKSTEVVSKMSLLKNKVPPERLAAIEKKRLFNKKLRDIVESCLEKPDGNQKILNSRNILKPKDTENVDTLQTRDSTLSNSQDNTISYLEARLQKMENILLKKIEQNSNRITDLKNSIAPGKRTSVYTQTPYSDQANKIFLYESISKYLSSKAKDLVYEELFIYNYSDHLSDEDSKHKRKKRR